MKRSGENVVATPTKGTPSRSAISPSCSESPDEQHLLAIDAEEARRRVEVRAPLGEAAAEAEREVEARSPRRARRSRRSSTPLFDETAIRTPGRGRPSSARRVSAGIWMALQRAGFCDSNISEAPRVARIARVDLLELAGERQPAGREVELAREDRRRRVDLLHHLGGDLGQRRHAVDERPVEVAEQHARKRQRARAPDGERRRPEPERDAVIPVTAWRGRERRRILKRTWPLGKARLTPVAIAGLTCWNNVEFQSPPGPISVQFLTDRPDHFPTSRPGLDGEDPATTASGADDDDELPVARPRCRSRSRPRPAAPRPSAGRTAARRRRRCGCCRG